MAVPDSATFLLRFPEFGELSSDVISGSLAEAGRSCSTTVWGDRHTDGVSQLAAHLLATRQVQIGLQVGAQSGNPLGTELQATTYGQEFRRLLSSLPLSGFAF